MASILDPESVEWPTVGRFGLGGLLAGGSAAATLALLHMLRQAAEERKEEARRNRTSEDTIVLTLPRMKSAEVKSDKPIKVVSVGPETTERPFKDSSGKTHHYDGTFGTKCATWQTLTLATLAALGGGALGYSLVDRIYANKRIKRKQEILDQIRQEYLDSLMPVKESADRSAFNMVDYPVALAALALLLGSGGTAYLTKRILDERSREAEQAGKDPMRPETRRIVFKTAEATGDADPEIESEKIAAVIGIMMDVCSGRPDILGSEECQSELKKAGLTPGDLYKAAGYAEDYSTLLATLEANKPLRRLIQRLSAERHPVLRHAKWLISVPGISGIADRRLYEGVDTVLGPKSAAAPLVLPMPSVPGMLTASVLGSHVANVMDRHAGSAAQADEKSEEEETPEARASRVLSQLTVAAKDPNAARFIEENATEIKELLRQLAVSGQL